MSKFNQRAIAKLLEAQKILRKVGRSADTSAGQAFAGDLIRLLETGKPITVEISDEGDMVAQATVKPADVRVSKTTVILGKQEIPLCHLQNGTDGDYELLMLVECPGDPLGVPHLVTLKEAA